MGDDSYVYSRLNEDNGREKKSGISRKSVGLIAALCVVGGFAVYRGCCESGNDVDKSLRSDEAFLELELIPELKLDPTDQCGGKSSADDCDCDSDSCVWCTSKAIPSKCYPKEMAKRLPPGVFKCDKVEEPTNLMLDVTFSTYEKDKLGDEELLCDDSVNQALGYFRIGDQDKHYFFWFFESRDKPETDPVVLWMTGGPGCSSELALFVENGPCSVNSDGETTKRNDFSWNNNANLIYIDQPAGTGFSYGDHDTNEVSVGNDMDLFVREFLGRFHQFKKNDFYVFGESYAGHYVPATGHAISERNKDLFPGMFKINLKGIGIGNGLTDPLVQYEFYADMAFNSGTAPARISRADFEKMKAFTPHCLDMIKACNEYEDNDEKGREICIKAVNECNEKLMTPYAMSGYNQYDMRIKCQVPGLCYDFSAVEKFLHQKKVLDYLGVAPEKRDWQSCDGSAHTALMADWMKDYENWVEKLLDENEDIRVLVYAGDVDFIVNYLGCRAWPLRLDWKGKEGYNNAGNKEWKVDGEVAGMLRSFENLSFLQVYQAGHMVPMDKPKAALKMLNDFIFNK